MIYLKVRGGLCNRLRAIDSLIDLAKDYNNELTVIWPLDTALNAKFDDLFELNQDRNVEIINSPAGYPEKYFPTVSNQIKNLIRGRFLNENEKKIIKEIKKLKGNKFLSEEQLDEKYNFVLANNEGNVSLMDQIFIEKTKSIIDDLLRTRENFYLNSCYRHSHSKRNYSYFKPKKELLNKINNTTSKFKGTYGLHIRRSDHEASKAISTLDKFTKIIDKELFNNDMGTFFLSTDDEGTKQALIKRYGDKIIYNRIESYDRNSKQAVEDAVIDLYCLSRTKLLFGSHHSSFSQVAAAIGGIEEITAL